MSSQYFRSPEAEYYAQNPGAFEEKLKRDQKTQRMLNVGRLGAGAIDFFGGRRDVKDAEGQLTDLTGQADTIQEELGSMRAPGSMDSNTVAEATRNAAILGFQTPAADPADDLAAQAMALESGVDPTKLYAEASGQAANRDAMEAAEASSDFKTGLQMAQDDAMKGFQQDYNQKAMELDDVNQQILSTEQQLAEAELRKQKGAQTAIAGGAGYLTSGGGQQIKDAYGNVRDKIKSALGGKESTEPFVAENQGFEIDPTQQQDRPIVTSDSDLGQGQEVQGLDTPKDPYSFSAGGSVQQTPGEYDHDTNDMILMAQGKDGMLVDTGIRQTGGEYVIDPFDAGNMRQAHEKIDPVELELTREGRAPMSEDLLMDLMQLYDAVRFVKEPQFEEDYYEKKMQGYA